MTQPGAHPWVRLVASRWPLRFSGPASPVGGPSSAGLLWGAPPLQGSQKQAGQDGRASEGHRNMELREQAQPGLQGQRPGIKASPPQAEPCRHTAHPGPTVGRSPVRAAQHALGPAA